MAKKLDCQESLRIRHALGTLHKYFKTQREIAIALDMKHTANISQWFTGERLVPPLRALQVEKATKGKVKAAHLRPDIDFSIY